MYIKITSVFYIILQMKNRSVRKTTQSKEL